MPRDRLATTVPPVAEKPRPVPARNGDRSAAKFCVRLIITVPTVLWLVAATPLAVAADEDDALAGVRYRVDASVSIEQDSPLISRIRQTGSADADGVVNVQLRISANSREIRYFGIVSKDLPLRLPPADPVWQKVWEESVCHQRRGQPKLTVVRVSGRWPATPPAVNAPTAPPDAETAQPGAFQASPVSPPPASPHLIPETAERGTSSTGTARSSVDFISAIRHIGMPLRDDELVPGIKLPEGVDEVGPYYDLRAQTKDNRLNADLRLYAFACRVDAARFTPTPEQPLR